MKLTATKRDLLGKKVKRLRREGHIPAVIFGKGEGSTPISLDLREFAKVFSAAGEASLIDLTVDGGAAKKVLVTEIQKDPISGEIIHVNLHAIKLTEKITASVPVEIIGESDPVKGGTAILLTLLNEVEVECLPTDLPPKIEVDVTNLTEIGQGIKVKDLNIDRSKVAVKQGDEDLVVRLDSAEMKEEVAPEEEKEAPKEAEVIMEKKEEEVGAEGAVAAEGEVSKQPAQEEKKEEKK